MIALHVLEYLRALEQSTALGGDGVMDDHIPDGSHLVVEAQGGLPAPLTLQLNGGALRIRRTTSRLPSTNRQNQDENGTQVSDEHDVLRSTDRLCGLSLGFISKSFIPSLRSTPMGWGMGELPRHIVRFILFSSNLERIWSKQKLRKQVGAPLSGLEFPISSRASWGVHNKLNNICLKNI